MKKKPTPKELLVKLRVYRAELLKLKSNESKAKK